MKSVVDEIALLKIFCEIMIPILFSDEHLIVVDKPTNLLSVPGRTVIRRIAFWRVCALFLAMF